MRTDNFINYKISTNNIHIADSFQYTTKKEMKEIIQYLKKLYPDHIVFTRSISSLVKDRTKDIDLECPQKWYYKIAYFFIISTLYIKIKNIILCKQINIFK